MKLQVFMNDNDFCGDSQYITILIGRGTALISLVLVLRQFAGTKFCIDRSNRKQDSNASAHNI